MERCGQANPRDLVMERKQSEGSGEVALGLEFGVDQAKVRVPRQMEGRGSWQSLLQAQGPEEVALQGQKAGAAWGAVMNR